jgi:microcystin-dependent protein
MSDPYIGEIRMFAGNFPPNGWMFCDGTSLPISENDTLFTLIGTTYGGDGQSTFNLPDLRGRIPLHRGTLNGTPYQLAEQGGVESVTLTTQQIPSHTHTMLASTGQATDVAPGNLVPASPPLATVLPYGTDNPLGPLAANSITPVGGSQPHDNMHPFTCLNFIISLFGIFPHL